VEVGVLPGGGGIRGEASWGIWRGEPGEAVKIGEAAVLVAGGAGCRRRCWLPRSRCEKERAVKMESSTLDVRKREKLVVF
jgi:hypothetical protein